jgi:hypothetical protein
MAKEKLADRRGTLGEPASVVQITVTFPGSTGGDPRWERPASFRTAWRALTPLIGVLVVVAFAGISTYAVQRGRTGAAGGAGADRVHRAGTAAVAAAFGYPPRCLTITISSASPDHATAHLDRGAGCANYHGYVNASLHRVDGVWRLVLDEGQLFVPNSLLIPCRVGRAGCARGRNRG